MFASEKKAASYDKAVELLIDLRDLAARGDRREFLLKFNALKQPHSRKSSFIGRLRILTYRNPQQMSEKKLTKNKILLNQRCETTG